MISRSTATDLETIENINVPDNFRPRLGADQKAFAQIERNLESAWIESAKNLRVELIEQISALIIVAGCDGESYDALALQELLRRANNIRGMAEADGSELTSDIAHAIFEIVEGIQAPTAAPKQAIQLLAEGCCGLLGFDRLAKDGVLHEHVQRMIRTAHGSV